MIDRVTSGTKPALLAIFGLVFALAGQTVFGGEAVIVGIGHYDNPNEAPSLPGIHRDIRHAEMLARWLGYSRAETVVLADGQASLARVQRAIHEALSGAQGNSAFIYFSGHGTHVLDSQGRSDEALVMADYRWTGGGHADGALMGHWIGRQLAAAHVRRVLLIADACQSGRITKGLRVNFSRYAVNKYVATPGAPPPIHARLFRAEAIGAPWVAMSPVQDNQDAPASNVGSPYTTSLVQVVAKARLTHKALTPRELRNAVAAVMQTRGSIIGTSPDDVDPQVWSSSKRLLSEPMSITPAAGHLWAELERIVANSMPGAVSIHVAKTRWHSGEDLTLQLDLARGGYLTVLNADQKDEAAVLVPNPSLPKVYLRAGHYTLPTDIHSIPWKAVEPEKVLLVAIVTPHPLDLGSAQPGKGIGDYGPNLTPALMRLLNDQLLDKGLGGEVRPRLFHAVISDAAQNLSTVTRPEAVGVEMEIVQ